MAHTITEQTLDEILQAMMEGQGAAVVLPPACYHDAYGERLERYDEVVVKRGPLAGAHADFLGGGYGAGSGMVWLDVWEVGQVSIPSRDVELAVFA